MDRAVSALCALALCWGASAEAKEPLRPKKATAKKCQRVALEKPRVLAIESTSSERTYAFRMKAPAINPKCTKFGRRNLAAWLDVTALVRNEYGQLRRIPWEKSPDGGTALGHGNRARSTRTLVKFLPWRLCDPPDSQEKTKILSKDARVVAVSVWRPAGEADIAAHWLRPKADPADRRRNAVGIAPSMQLRHHGAVKRLCGDGGPPPP